MIVVKRKSSNLLGRDWRRVICVDWANIKAIALGRPAMEDLISKYSDMFAPGTGTMHHEQAQLCPNKGVQPQFCWPYTVPYALKEKVGK